METCFFVVGYKHKRTEAGVFPEILEKSNGSMGGGREGREGYVFWTPVGENTRC